MKTRATDNTLFTWFVGGLALTATMPLMAGGPALSGIVAKADNAEAAFTSPAGMSRLKGTNFSFDTMVALSQSRFKVDDSKTEVDGGDADLNNNPTVIPSMYYVRQLNDR